MKELGEDQSVRKLVHCGRFSENKRASSALDKPKRPYATENLKNFNTSNEFYIETRNTEDLKEQR